MADIRIMIVGLPSEGSRALSTALGAPVVTGDDVLRAHEAPDDVRDIARKKMVADLAKHFPADGSARALLVYQTPWRYLDRQLRISRSTPQTHAHFEWFARNACDFWSAYHACLLAFYREHEMDCLLLNGDRGIEPGALDALLQERLGLAPGAVAETAAARAVSEESYWQVVDRIAPDCLELYSLLESSAALLGRDPEFGFGLFPHREGRPLNLVQAELKALSPASREKLYLTQIHQLERELKHYVQRDREREELLTPKLERKARSLWASAARLLKFAPLRAKRQEKAIRSSGLFDEQWYLRQYPDVGKAGMDPVAHYLRFGVAEGRNPGPGFDTRWYLYSNADVARNNLNPLLHYIQFGQREGRRPLEHQRPAPGAR